MALIAGNEGHWQELSQGSQLRAWMGDTERLADAVEVLIDPASPVARGRFEEFVAVLGAEPVRGEN